MAGEIQIDSVTALTASGSDIVLNNVNTATNRTNLGLGSIATQAADSVSISGGNITGGTIGSGVVFPALGNSAVGTVSESSGTPTGDIIERGSNANGEYVKFADGTMICQMFAELFDFNTTGSTDFPHPADFVNRFPVRFASIVDGSTGGVTSNEGIALLGLTGTDTNSRATVTTAKSGTQDIGITVIGRWY